MIEHLEIRNFALIENLSVDFSEGFNVITGETGAGKSIILGALGLLMGEKADISAVRAGAEEIVVNAVVSIPEDHEILPWLAQRDIFPEDGAIMIRRTVKAKGGRSLIYVQGQLFSRQDLCFLADSIIDMHGQSEHQSLLLSEKQRIIIDNYAQNKKLLDSCSESFHRIGALEKQKNDILQALQEGRRQEDYLRFALEEIENADIKENEDEELREKVRVLSQFESIYENLTLCNERLRDMKALFHDASASCAKACRCDSALSDFCARIESTRIETEDISQGLRDYLGSVDYSEDVINSMQDRLAVLQKLKRKYGPTLDDVQAFGRKAGETLDLTQNSQDRLDACEKALSDAKEDYDRFSSLLSSSRKKAAGELEKKIQSVLRTLGMPDALFRINVIDENRISSNGRDHVEFMICANPGEQLKELKNIASGGELSRVMLALKTVLAKADSIQTQVFDEVDSGIGGSVALSLANCIADLSRCKQVIAITHLASIASCAGTQLVVSKSVENGRTFTWLSAVSGEDRVKEIARMLSGDESEVSLEHARKMLQ